MKKINKDFYTKADVRTLSLAEQLERVTAQRNGLISLLHEWALRYCHAEEEELLYVKEARGLVEDLIDEIRLMIDRMDPSLEKEDSLKENKPPFESMKEEIWDVVGNLYETEGFNPVTDDMNPEFKQEDMEISRWKNQT